MSKTAYWTVVAVATTGLVVLIGIAFHLYAAIRADRCDGTVAQVQPVDQSDNEQPKSYLVELRTDDQEVQVFPSTDWRWAMVSPGDRVQARLLPAFPWSNVDGRWRNGLLTDKFYKDPNKATAQAQNGEKAFGGLTNVALSLMMFCLLWNWKRLCPTMKPSDGKADK